MDIPYGFDCYAFSESEIKYFDSSILKTKSNLLVPYSRNVSTALKAHQGYLDPISGQNLNPYIRFTRKNEEYSGKQLQALALAGRLNTSEMSKQIFCGIKIQVGIGIVTNFLQKGMQYRRPNRGRSELINGSWTGIVSGLTVDRDAHNSYDVAFGNFLAYDEEFPYMNFGPFFAIESKLVMLTGRSHRIEQSSFGTNIQDQIWFLILVLMMLLSLLSTFRVHFRDVKYRAFDFDHSKHLTNAADGSTIAKSENQPSEWKKILKLVQDFFFIFYTMLLNKPSLEFDEFIWPKRRHTSRRLHHHISDRQKVYGLSENQMHLSDRSASLKRMHRKRRKRLPTSIKILSYLWSAACFVMVSIYSGELLAVILLHSEPNIDTISQLINSKPPIEPVIRQDDFLYNLMLKSLDQNMIILHNKTKIIPRSEVYTKQFIQRVSERKQALLGDDELIETIYDIYHKYYPLYKSKVTYLQYPISFMYRKDLNRSIERELRRGMVQIFEMGLIHRWYQAQKETYIKFYDSFENINTQFAASIQAEQKYKPLSMQHFKSFFRFMLLCIILAFIVLLSEILHYSMTNDR